MSCAASRRPGRVGGGAQGNRSIARQDHWPKAGIVDAIRQAVPELQHLERNRSLDSKF